ncbi:hypothetical protein GCM10010347_62760 [Streptomyces cirratus]|uniref:Uncharacterized protein n=1 Tax=Streptomyces cirratus TaxID=68187 RepID=A0ABQ3F1W7_9ACTN|nr:hypothetical protein GCM10010347_62760 [Streptomyces cirratus]
MSTGMITETAGCWAGMWSFTVGYRCHVTAYGGTGCAADERYGRTLIVWAYCSDDPQSRIADIPADIG